MYVATRNSTVKSSASVKWMYSIRTRYLLLDHSEESFWIIFACLAIFVSDELSWLDIVIKVIIIQPWIMGWQHDVGKRIVWQVHGLVKGTTDHMSTSDISQVSLMYHQQEDNETNVWTVVLSSSSSCKQHGRINSPVSGSCVRQAWETLAGTCRAGLLLTVVGWTRCTAE